MTGYHMAVVAGVASFAVRALLALIPLLTVSFPIKNVFISDLAIGWHSLPYRESQETLALQILSHDL